MIQIHLVTTMWENHKFSQGRCLVLWHSHVRGVDNRREPLLPAQDKEQRLQGKNENRIRVSKKAPGFGAMIKNLFSGRTLTLDTNSGMPTS